MIRIYTLVHFKKEVQVLPVCFGTCLQMSGEWKDQAFGYYVWKCRALFAEEIHMATQQCLLSVV